MDDLLGELYSSCRAGLCLKLICT